MATTIPGIVYVSQDLRFTRPVYVGEEVEVVVQVTDGDKQFWNFDTTIKKGEGKVVVRGKATAKVPAP